MAHSILPPSSADKWINCPGWLEQNKDILEEFSGPSEEGTLAHKYLEALIDNRKFNRFDGPLPEASSEIEDRVFSVFEWAMEQPGELHSELRVDFGSQFDINGERGYDDLYGTADLVFVEPDCLSVADLKYGLRVQVEVRNNYQLLTYLSGAVAKFGKREKYRLVILQPRGQHPDGQIREWTIKHETLEAFNKKLEDGIRNNLSRALRPTAGDHCEKFCKALATCPAVKEQAIQVFRDSPVEELTTLDKLDEVAKQVPLISAWLSAVEKKILETLESGEELTNATLVPKNAIRKWNPEVDILSVLSSLGSIDEVAPREPISPSKAASVLGKQAAKELEQYAIKESSGMKVSYVK
jgi:hypothetical protein